MKKHLKIILISKTNGQIQGNSILIAMDSPKYWQSTVGHEVMHALEQNGGYDTLQEMILKYAEDNGEFQRRYDATMELYRGQEGYADDADLDEKIRKEVTADLVGDYLFQDSEFVKRLSVENRNVFQKIYEEIKYLLRVVTAGSKEARALEKLKHTFEQVYKENGKAEAESTAKHSIGYDANGETFVNVEDITVSENNTAEDIAKILSDIVKNKYTDFVNVHNQKIGINQKTAREWQRSKSAQHLLSTDSTAYTDKMNAFNNADELLMAAKNYIGEEIKHSRKDNIVEFARGDINFKVGENGYSADVIVGTTKSGAAVLYDIVNLQAKKIEGVSNTAQDRRTETSSNESIAPSAAVVNTISENSEKSVPAETDTAVKWSLRKEAPPTKTEEVYKLMKLNDDGKLYPLFIDSAEGIEVGKWYNADSPDMAILKTMPSGVFLVDPSTNTYQSLDEYVQESGERKTKYPSRKAVEKAATEGKRWVFIEDTARTQRRYDGESRKYWNLGINGSGSVSTFAMRPGWHAGSLPTMRQIGKGKDRNLRDDSFVWVVGEVPADIEYQTEADQNPDKDIPYHIPKDGYYLKATNADSVKSQADTVGWYVAGAFKANKIISDSEARQAIDNWNNEHPDALVEYDYDRESGMDFDAEQMKLVPRGDIKYSLSDNEGRSITPEQAEYLRDSVVRDENGNLKVMYHGTSRGGFTVFDSYGGRHGLFGLGSYFTDSKTMGESYTKKGKGTSPQVYEAYLNITNPIDMDAPADANYPLAQKNIP